MQSTRIDTFTLLPRRRVYTKNPLFPAHAVKINSSANKKYKIWKSLTEARGIHKHSLAIVSGGKIVRELCRNRKDIIRTAVFSSRNNRKQSETEFIYRFLEINKDIDCAVLQNEFFREIDILGTNSPLLIVDIPTYIHNKPKTYHNTIVPLIPFQDPSNVGAAVRTAAAFGLQNMIMLKESATPYHPKAIRASAAQVFAMDFVDGPSIYNLETIDIPVVALSPEGQNIEEFEFPDTCALLAGIEGPGLPVNFRPDHTVAIGMQPEVESLNAAISLSIALYEWRRQKRR